MELTNIISHASIKRNLALSALTGILLALSMPKPGWWPLAWVGLVPLLVAVIGSKPRQAFLYGWISGAIYYGVILHWLTVFGYLPWAVLVAKEALYIGVFAVGASRLGPSRRRKIGYLAVPALWVAVQYVRTIEPFSFTWGSLAHTQAVNTGLIQIASITGTWGIDFILVLSSMALSVLIVTRGAPTARNVTTATYAACVALSVSGHMMPAHLVEQERGIETALIQGNLDQNSKSNEDYNRTAFQEYASSSLAAARLGAHLIVWPETSLTSTLSGTVWGEAVSQLAEMTRDTYVVGAYDALNPTDLTRLSNSAFIYNPQGNLAGLYRKIRLVPYGEFVPLRDKMPWLKGYGIREYDVVPGKSFKPIEAGLAKIGVTICFESLFSGMARKETRDGATLLVILTNDGWFLRSHAAQHHLMMAQLRAVENRRYVLRSAATGISAVIDPYGRICDKMGIFEKGIVYGRVHPRHELTIYTRFGDWLAYLCIAGVIVTLVWQIPRVTFSP